MGQTSSRNRPVPPVASSGRVAEPSGSQSSPEISPSSTPRRSNVRKSLLNLVKRKSSRSLVGHEGSRRKSWRHSRHVSKVPSNLPQVVSEPSQDVAGPSSSPVLEKGKEREQLPDPETTDIVITEPSQSAGASAPPAESETRQEHEDKETSDDQAAEATLANRLGLSRHGTGEEEVVLSPERFVENPTELPVSIPAVPEPLQQMPANRQFPPSGTIVVVQGVVHTTDIQRPPPFTDRLLTGASNPVRRRASSTPRPSSSGNEPTSARNRLSALLRARPSSAVYGRSSSSASSRHSIVPITTTSSASPAESSLSSESSDSSATGASSITTLPVASESTTPPSNPPHDSRTAISSSSIDVLGTLLRYPLAFSN